jgi:cytochrome c-type biogenesis protein CcmE
VIDEVEAPPAGATTARRRLHWSFVAAGLAVAGAVAYLIFANTSASAAYYLTIGQVRTCHTCADRAVRIAGQVAPNSIVRNDATQVIHFTITDSSAGSGAGLPVVYNGVVPDIFRGGVTVVVQGKLAASGQFQAQTLLAKCPSKFQSATPGASSS